MDGHIICTDKKTCICLRIHGCFNTIHHFLYGYDGLIRTVNKSYRENFDLLLSSRLYEKLTKKGLLIPHKEIKVIGLPENGIIYKTIKPDLIPFVSLRTLAMITIDRLELA